MSRAWILDFDKTIVEHDGAILSAIEARRHERSTSTWRTLVAAYEQAKPVELMSGESSIDALQLLARLGIPHAIVTHSPSALVEAWFSARMLAQPETIAYHDITGSGGSLKPEPDGLLAAMERLGVVVAKHTVHIGDDPNDHLAASRAGLIAGSWSTRADCIRMTPDIFLPSVSALINAADRWTSAAVGDVDETVTMFACRMDPCSFFSYDEYVADSITVAGTYWKDYIHDIRDVEFCSNDLSGLVRDWKGRVEPAHSDAAVAAILSALLSSIDGALRSGWISAIPDEDGEIPERFEAPLEAVSTKHGHSVVSAWTVNRPAAKQHDRGVDRRANRDGVLCASSEVEGRDIVLVDDVITTGSTIADAVRALRVAGARTIHVLALARTGFTGPRNDFHPSVAWEPVLIETSSAAAHAQATLDDRLSAMESMRSVLEAGMELRRSLRSARDQVGVIGVTAEVAPHIAKARKSHPRAYEPWTDTEEAELVALMSQVGPERIVEEACASLGRQPGGIKSRLRKLGLLE